MESKRKIMQEAVADGCLDLEAYYKAVEAATFLNVSRRTFERMKDAGQIPYIRCAGGRVLRYRRSDLIAAMSALVVR